MDIKYENKYMFIILKFNAFLTYSTALYWRSGVETYKRMLSFPTFPIADIPFSTLSFPTLCSIMSKTGMSEMEMSEMITNPYKLQYNKYPNQTYLYMF